MSKVIRKKKCPHCKKKTSQYINDELKWVCIRCAKITGRVTEQIDKNLYYNYAD